MTQTQISLDVTTLAEAIPMAEAAVRAGVDWLEAGTPLILGEGVHAVRALRERFPGTPIVADIKCMDGGGLEAAMFFDAGADFVLVMGQAHDATILRAVEAANKRGKQIMVDVMLCLDKAARARQAQAFGAHIIVVHTGFDERGMVKGASPLGDLQAVLEAVSIPVQAVGGLSVEQALRTLEMGAQIVVFGAPLVVMSDAFKASQGDFEALLHELVTRVKRTP
jgi:3-hexulose-6-phosphate synthase/6-phospho-3-hexuloisomerase